MTRAVERLGARRLAFCVIPFVCCFVGCGCGRGRGGCGCLGAAGPGFCFSRLRGPGRISRQRLGLWRLRLRSGGGWLCCVIRGVGGVFAQRGCVVPLPLWGRACCGGGFGQGFRPRRMLRVLGGLTFGRGLIVWVRHAAPCFLLSAWRFLSCVFRHRPSTASLSLGFRSLNPTDGAQRGQRRPWPRVLQQYAHVRQKGAEGFSPRFD